MRLALLLILPLLVLSCGQKGPLVLPPADDASLWAGSAGYLLHE